MSSSDSGRCMQQGYGLGQQTSTLEHQAQESVAECGDNCICVQLDGFDIMHDRRGFLTKVRVF